MTTTYSGPDGIRQYLADAHNIGLEGDLAQYRIAANEAMERWHVPEGSIDWVEGSWREPEVDWGDPFTVYWHMLDNMPEFTEPGCKQHGKWLVICGVTNLSMHDTLCWFVLEQDYAKSS